METTSAFLFARKELKMLTKVKKVEVSQLEKIPSSQDIKHCPAVSLSALGKGHCVAKAQFLDSLAQF